MNKEDRAGPAIALNKRRKKAHAKARDQPSQKAAATHSNNTFPICRTI